MRPQADVPAAGAVPTPGQESERRGRRTRRAGAWLPASPCKGALGRARGRAHPRAEGHPGPLQADVLRRRLGDPPAARRGSHLHGDLRTCGESADGRHPVRGVFSCGALAVWLYFASAVSAAAQSLVDNRVSSRRSTSRACSRRLLRWFPASSISRSRCRSSPSSWSSGRSSRSRGSSCCRSGLRCAGHGPRGRLLLAGLNVRYRDVRFALPFLLQVWFFASPSSTRPRFSTARGATCTPSTRWRPIVTGFRWSIAGGPAPDRRRSCRRWSWSCSSSAASPTSHVSSARSRTSSDDRFSDSGEGREQAVPARPRAVPHVARVARGCRTQQET